MLIKLQTTTTIENCIELNASHRLPFLTVDLDTDEARVVDGLYSAQRPVVQVTTQCIQLLQARRHSNSNTYFV